MRTMLVSAEGFRPELSRIALVSQEIARHSKHEGSACMCRISPLILG